MDLLLNKLNYNGNDNIVIFNMPEEFSEFEKSIGKEVKIYKNKKSKLVEFTQKCSFCFIFSLFKHSQSPQSSLLFATLMLFFFIIIFVIFEKRKDWLHYGFNW